MVQVEAVWEQFNQELGSYIRSRVADESTADDLLQEVYLKIHTHIDSLRQPDRVQAWVYQITRNVVHDYYRQQQPVVELVDAIPSPDVVDTPDDTLSRLQRSIVAMLDCLPAEYREALVLTELQGLTQQEAADQLGLSLSGMKSRVQRGRKMLREALLACCHFQFDRLGEVIDYHPRCRCCANEACAQ